MRQKLRVSLRTVALLTIAVASRSLLQFEAPPSEEMVMRIDWNNPALWAVRLPSGHTGLSMGIFKNGRHRYVFHWKIKHEYCQNTMLVGYLPYWQCSSLTARSAVSKPISPHIHNTAKITNANIGQYFVTLCSVVCVVGAGRAQSM